MITNRMDPKVNSELIKVIKPKLINEHLVYFVVNSKICTPSKCSTDQKK